MSNLASQEDIDSFSNNTDLNWGQFYYYFSLQGLHNTDTFKNEIENDSLKNDLFNAYVNAGKNFTKDCSN